MPYSPVKLIESAVMGVPVTVLPAAFSCRRRAVGPLRQGTRTGLGRSVTVGQNEPAAPDQGEKPWQDWADFLRRVAMKKYGLSAEDAEDLSQEVLCRVLVHADEVETWVPYLLETLRHAVFDFWKRQKNRRTESLDAPIGAEWLSLAEIVPCCGPLPDEAFATGERLAAVLGELKDIIGQRSHPQRDWYIFIQAKVLGRAPVQVAAELGVSRGVVDVVICRILKELAHRLAPEVIL